MQDEQEFELGEETAPINELNLWRTNPVTVKLRERFERQLKKLQQKHNDAEYGDLKEVMLNQTRLQVLDRFLKNVFAIEKVAEHKNENQ